MFEEITNGMNIANGGCLEVLREIPENSVDAVVTDPPYGLTFMGKDWDSFGTGKRQPCDRNFCETDNAQGRSKVRSGCGSKYHASMIAFEERMTPVFEEALRVAKPGAYLLAFGGTRTYHRLACAIEDAGWEIRDCVGWLYGSGSPKSMDVAKAIDKASGYKGKVIGREIVDTGMQGGNMHAGRSVNLQEREIRELSSEAKEWEGWGTALKPAWEPIIMARKPLDGTVANSVTTWGTGAINIDGSRIPVAQDDNVFAKNPHTMSKGSDAYEHNAYGKYGPTDKPYDPSKGRFPANIIHDGSDEVLFVFPSTASARKGKPRKGVSGNGWGMTATGAEYVDSGGSAARFFYCAKASKKERGQGNDHPTVKPQALMRYLVRMVTREGATVLDPFMGSGSTGIACLSEGRRFIGIEREPDYCEIARRRLWEQAEDVSRT